MKEKSGKCKRAILVLLFTLAATVLLVGTATAVTHTEVESVTRYAPAGPAPGAEFDVRLTINGEIPLVVGIVETIPEGFSFVSTTHPSDQYEVSGRKISFAVIDETEINYEVIAPSSGEGTFTGEWVDLLVLSPELGEGKERWETIAETIVMVGGGGAGAIDGGVTATPSPTPFVPAVTKASRTVPLTAGEEVAMIFEDMDVSLIALTADSNVSEAKVVVERIEKSAEIPEPSGIAYAYLDISVEHEEDAKIEGRIECKVTKSWITDNSIDGAMVTLNRYDKDDGWKALATSKTDEDADFAYFEADTPEFSTFAVTGEKKVVAAAAATATPTVAAPTPAATATSSPATPASEVPGFEVIFAVVSLLIVYTMVFRKKVKGGDVK